MAATVGNEKAQNNLAGLYADGLGGKQRYAKAALWFQKAADNGVYASKFNLANLYEDGMGVPQNTAKAIELFKSAATQGDAAAAFNIGQIYATGRADFAKDATQAIIWYQRAAERGYASAQ